MNQLVLIIQCILFLFSSSDTITKDFIKSAGKALKTGAKETDKAFKTAGDELSKTFNWEMNVKNNTPFTIYTAILYVDEKQQFAIGAKTAEWILTVATLPIGGGGSAAAKAGGEVAETAATIAAREGAEAITTAAAREITETATTAAAREIAETATTTAAREGAESVATTGARAAARETTESAAQKVGTEAAETATKPITTAKPLPKPKPRIAPAARAEAQTVEQAGKTDISRLASVVDSPKAPSSATRGVRFGTEEVQTFAPEQAPSRITQSVTGKAESIPGKSILKPTQQTEVVASRTANISKAERFLGGKPGVQEQAKLNLYQKFAKSPASKEMTFETWLQKNPQQLADEIARVGVGGKTAIGSAPESAATKEAQKVGTEAVEAASKKPSPMWEVVRPEKPVVSKPAPEVPSKPLTEAKPIGKSPVRIPGKAQASPESVAIPERAPTTPKPTTSSKTNPLEIFDEESFGRQATNVIDEPTEALAPQVIKYDKPLPPRPEEVLGSPKQSPRSPRRDVIGQIRARGSQEVTPRPIRPQSTTAIPEAPQPPVLEIPAPPKPQIPVEPAPTIKPGGGASLKPSAEDLGKVELRSVGQRTVAEKPVPQNDDIASLLRSKFRGARGE